MARDPSVFVHEKALCESDRVGPRTRVWAFAHIMPEATVGCGVTIGEQAFVGAGSVVTADVPAHALMVGNPARRVGWACACGYPLPADLACGCGRQYRLVDERSGLAPNP